MDKKAFIMVLFVLCLLSINVAVAQESDNSTSDDVLTVSNDDPISSDSKVPTHIDVESNTTFDVVGDYFKVKLADENNKTIANSKVTFTVNGKTYTQNTDSKGIASLQLRLNDGTYKIVTKYAGNANYKASSLTTTIKMSNTRVVDAGLTNSEIQSIIDNAKVNNVILFKGSSYSNINLVITKSLTLISNVDTTLKSSSSSPVITIKGSKASLTKIKGFNIQGNGDGIKVDGANFVTIMGNDITTKGNGIVGLNTKYLNVTNNNIVKNSKNGISVADSSSVYIFNNKITYNGEEGVAIANSNHVYLKGNTISNNGRNGISLTSKINGVEYGYGPENVYLYQNTVNSNKWDGISINNAGDNINIKGNTISYNEENGISINEIGSNKIQSNVITNSIVGIKFNDDYKKPTSQDISYNAIYSNSHVQVEAMSYRGENGEKLYVGDNWYTDDGLLCPKVNTKNLKFVVNQIGPNQFQASFLDSNGNIASLLPDRTLTYTNNGKTYTITISGGAGTFTVDANNDDIIKATVDRTSRRNAFNSNTPVSKPINGQSQSYSYPNIPQYELFEDIGKGGGNGNGNGEGNSGDSNSGNGKAAQESNVNGNSTHSSRPNPSNGGNNQINDVPQNYETEATSPESASESGGADSPNKGSSGQQSVIKQLAIEEDEFFRITGISLIILLILLTIGFYYREDIKEMNSKR